MAVFQTVNVVFGESAKIATMFFTAPMKFSFGQLLTFKQRQLAELNQWYNDESLAAQQQYYAAVTQSAEMAM